MLSDRHVPYYIQLRDILAEQIDSGKFHVGDQIPTEDELMRTYHVSRATVRQAIAELARQGRLVRERGRGTFVTQPLITQNARIFTTFAQDMARSGMRDSARLVSARQKRPHPDVAEALSIRRDDPVFELTRVRLGDDEPLAVRTSSIPVHLCPDLLDHDLESEPLYDLLGRLAGVTITSARQTFQAVAAGLTYGRLLHVPPRRVVMRCEGIIRGTVRPERNGTGPRPVEHAVVVYRGDRYRFTVDQSAPELAADAPALVGIGEVF